MLNVLVNRHGHVGTLPPFNRNFTQHKDAITCKMCLKNNHPSQSVAYRNSCTALEFGTPFRFLFERGITKHIFTHHAKISMHIPLLKCKNGVNMCIRFYLFLPQNIDCGYTLEPPCQHGSNVRTQFCDKNIRNMKIFIILQQNNLIFITYSGDS